MVTWTSSSAAHSELLMATAYLLSFWRTGTGLSNRQQSMRLVMLQLLSRLPMSMVTASSMLLLSTHAGFPCPAVPHLGQCRYSSVMETEHSNPRSTPAAEPPSVLRSLTSMVTEDRIWRRPSRPGVDMVDFPRAITASSSMEMGMVPAVTSLDSL